MSKKDKVFLKLLLISIIVILIVVFVINEKMKLNLELTNLITNSITLENLEKEKILQEIKDNQNFIFETLLQIIGFFITIVIFCLGFTLIYNRNFEKNVETKIKTLDKSLLDLQEIIEVNEYFQELMRVQSYYENKNTRLNTLRNKENQLDKEYFKTKNNSIKQKMQLLLNFKASALLEELDYERALEKYEKLLEISDEKDKGRIYYRKAHVNYISLINPSEEGLNKVIGFCNKAILYSDGKMVAAYQLKGGIYKEKSEMKNITEIQKKSYLEEAEKNIKKAIDLGLEDAKYLYYDIKFELLNNKESQYHEIIKLCDYEITETLDSRIKRDLKKLKEEIYLRVNKLKNYSNQEFQILNLLNIPPEDKVRYIKEKLDYLLKKEDLKSKELLKECIYLLDNSKQESLNYIGYYLIIKSIILKNQNKNKEAIKSCCIGIEKCKLGLRIESNEREFIYDSLGLGFYMKAELIRELNEEKGGKLNKNIVKYYDISLYYYKKILIHVGEEKEIYQEKCKIARERFKKMN